MKTIPSIQGHPLWGFAREFRRDPLHLAAHLAQQHGGIVQLRVLHRPLIAISDPAIARHILHRNPENYPRSFQYRNATVTLGEGLLTVEGDSWHRARRMMQPAFRSDPVRDIAGVTVGCWNDVERDLLQTIARGQKVDMAAECLRLAMDIILRALCGMQLPAPRVRLFGDLVTDALFRIRVRNSVGAARACSAVGAARSCRAAGQGAAEVEGATDARRGGGLSHARDRAYCAAGVNAKTNKSWLRPTSHSTILARRSGPR